MNKVLDQKEDLVFLSSFPKTSRFWEMFRRVLSTMRKLVAFMLKGNG